VLVNVPVRAKPPLNTLPAVSEVVGRWETKLDGRARILLRYSGTEPLARVMVEGDDQMTIETVGREIAAVIRTEIGS
jgi:phosphoglucosamine mutase